MFQEYQINYAGFWWRFLASMIDGLIMGVIFVPLGVVIGIGMASANDPDSPMLLAANYGLNGLEFLVGWLYFAFCESSSWQATLGKKVCGLLVTDMAGNQLTFGRATGRYFGKLLSGLICYIGFIMAGFTERKQALHDMVANTLVLKGPAVPQYMEPPPPPDFSYRGGGPLNI